MDGTKPVTTRDMAGSAVVNQHTGEKWVYSPIVKDHFFHPRNLLLEDPKEGEFDAVGMVGSPACGDVMKIWISVDPMTERVTQMKWQTFGCGSAIASTSMFSVMVTEDGGMRLVDALRIKPQQVMERLAGLPDRKIHCSVLADKAFRKAVNEYFRLTAQHERVMVEGARVMDARLHITDHDIEEAVLEGAQTLEEVQKKLKVGVGDPEAIPAIEELIRFYKEKYFG
ncbi:iron-sulfur cluster assembly scaffold protein [Candidatus Uhrbacteria bacterium]|nr:iron-sulfur cluster assembly scaffold protein [Candidatus Uhrbacteria bacterium]